MAEVLNGKISVAAASASGTEHSSKEYGQYRDELVAFVRRKFGRGPPEPEDVVQQALANFAAYSRRETVDNPRAFLYRTARNLALNFRKRERLGRRFLEPSPHPTEIGEVRDSSNPEAALMGKEQYRLVEDAIRAMPRMRRRILLLNRLEGLSYAEIARRLGKSETVVRKHVALAIRACGAVLLAAEQVDPQTGSRS